MIAQRLIQFPNTRRDKEGGLHHAGRFVFFPAGWPTISFYDFLTGSGPSCKFGVCAAL